MASTAQDRLDLVKANYDDAADHEASDLAKAQTSSQVAAIQANTANARYVYYSAVEAALSAAGDEVEAAYQAALNAQKQVANDRIQAASIAALIGSLRRATDKANSLVEIAASA